jgi:4-amino-4-deoxy-L-arabinose transferase-like glycosyltransferase
MDAHQFASYRGMVLAVAVAAALQLAVVARSPSVTADAIIFSAVSKDLAASPIETLRKYDQHPGFPAMLLAGARTVQALGDHRDPESWMLGGQLVSFICGLASVCVVWFFARDLFGMAAANLAAFIFAVLPVPRSSASDALSDTPHLLFYLLAAWLASTGISKGRILPLVGAGLSSGIAYWIRPEGLEVALVALAWLIWTGFREDWGVRRLGLATAALAGTALIVAGPYYVLAGKVTSKQLPFAKARAASLIAELKQPKPSDAAVPPQAATAASAPAATPAIAPAPVAAGAPTEPSKHAGSTRSWRPLAKAFMSFVNSGIQGFKWVFIPFYLLGHIELFRRRPDWLRLEFIWTLGVVHIGILLTVHLLSGYIAHRHLLPLIALAMPCTALGVIYVGKLLANRLGGRTTLATLATVGLAAAIVVPYTVRPFSREFEPVIEATRWVQTHAAPGTGIVSNSPYVGFYGTLPVAVLGHTTTSVDEALSVADNRAHYDYVVLHVGAHDYRPEWLAQVETKYRPIQVFPEFMDGKRAMRVMLFEAKDGPARLARSPQ